MKLLKKVKSIEAKRCFVFSQRFTSKNTTVKSIRDKIVKVDAKTFKQDLKKIKKEVLKINEKELDKIITADRNTTRLKAYDNANWYIGYADVDEVGAWREAGRVPKSWTKKSLKSTATIIAKIVNSKKSRFAKIRPIRVVPEIIKAKDILKREKYLFPIFLQGGTIPDCRKGMDKMALDIDDGNMRSFAFAVSGDKKIKAYIGIKHS